MPSFFLELRRRNVFRVTLAYLAMAWLLVQIADTVLPAFEVQTWVLRALIIGLVLGLPMAIAAAWKFELTPEGVRRTDEIPAGESFTRRTGRKLDFAIIAFLSLALITVVIDQYVLEGNEGPSVSTLAVLPLANLSGNPEEDYFVDGMTEALITTFARISALRVVSRTSVMRFKSSERSLPAIAAELGADAIITGSVARDGDRLRITAQLIDVATDTVLWGDSFERAFDDVFKTQREIAQAITDRIQVEVTPDEMARLARTAEASVDGYDNYLKGMERFYRLTPQDLEIAIEYFDRALEQNPNSALAHSGIAAAWVGLQQMGFVRASVAGPKSEAASLRALEIEPELAEPFLWLGVIRGWSAFNWPLAEEMFNKSIELNPNFADVRGSYSHLLAVLGRFNESLAQIEVGLQLDPFNGWLLGLYGVVYHMDHRHDEAITKFEEALRVSPGLPFVLMALAGSYHYSGRLDEAVQTDASYLDAVGMSDKREELLDRYEQHGYEPAMRLMADLTAEQSLAIGALGAWTATRYARAGDTEKAIEWLERAYEQRDPNIPYLRLPEFDQLRSDPRFQALMRSLDLL